MPDPLVVVRLREFKAQLLAREASQMAEMTRRWLDIERSLEARIGELAQEMLDYGGHISRWKLYEMERYRALLAQAKVQVAQYERWANGLITDKQAEWGALGLNHAQQAIQLSYFERGQIAPYFNRLPVEAIENMIGFSGDGAPLGNLLKQSFPDAWDGLTKALIDSTAKGINPRDTARAMKDGFGLGLNKAMVISRTEQLRAYRMASTEQYRESGVVSGFRRLAAHDERTCLGCLAAEGEFYELESELDDHPQGRCTAIPVVPGHEVEFTKGEEWFNTLDPAQQRGMMGKGRYEAWQAGQFQFKDLAVHKTNDTWGGSIGVKPLSQLVEAQ